MESRRLAPVAAVTVIAGVLPWPAGGGGGAGSITLYSGQHPQTTPALVAAFERRAGSRVGAQRRRGRASPTSWWPRAPTRRPTSSTPRTRRPSSSSQAKGLLAPVAPAPWRRSRPGSARPTGDWVGRVGPGERAWSTTPTSCSRGQLPTSVLGAGRPAVAGKLALAPERDRLPADRHLGRPRLRATRPPWRWLEGLKANAGGPHLPGQRDAGRPGQPRPGRPRA